MPRTERVPSFFLVTATVLAAACAAPSGPTPAACTGDEQCGPNARCRGTACVENAPPVAEFTSSGELVASAEIVLDASASHDPDAGDAISSYAWSVESADAVCPKPVITSTGKTVPVRFGCAGRWDVRLTVFDGKQLESAPVTRTLVVAERTGPAIVTAGDDQTVAHACSGAPLRCTTSAAVQLSATLDSVAALGVRWSVQPPAGRELDDGRRVRFVPDATALAPQVIIETDGTAISGDWVFRVEALNGTDVLASDVMRVSVTNQLPIALGQKVDSFPHTYNRKTEFFSVSGAFTTSISDPDGDPMLRSVTVHHTGDGTSVFEATSGEGSIAFSILVPRTNPLWLIGAPELSRSIRLEVTDVNGGAAVPVELPVVVANRPPQKVFNGAKNVPHGYDPAILRYTASASLGVWNDPDGDPIDHEVTMIDVAAADCPTSALTSMGEILAECQKPWTSAGDLAAFLVARTAEVVVADPWDVVPPSAWTFRITNRAPVAAASFTTRPDVACHYNGGATFCGVGGSGTPPRANVFDTLTSTISLSGLSDPDGDPLQVVPGSGLTGVTGSSCASGRSCTLRFTLPETEYCGTSLPSTTIPFTATDGASPVNLSLTVQPSCG